MRRSLPVLQPGAAPPDAALDYVWWVEPLRRSAVVVWLTIPIFALLAQPYAGRIVWTVAVASLPIFIVLVGYHRWRRICPLAFVNQLPTRFGRPGTRRVSPWVEENYHLIPLGLFVAGLWLRLIATNGDGPAMAIFFAGLSLVALLFGAVFTGKTWCQYICPVSFIEKIYTEPHGLRETRNSQCPKCTACKSACSDINLEKSYWKELRSDGKRLAYYAYPGLVFGFYFAYFLQSGTWDYYFGGSWTDEPGVIATAFLPGTDAATAGFFFFPAVPRAIASLLTLVVCASLSYLLFSFLQQGIRRWVRARTSTDDPVRVRHLTFALAAFVALVTFYSFAGQPTLRKLPWLPAYVTIGVVVVGTLTLGRRLRRSQDEFAEEALARNILKRWDWPDAPPKRLRDAYLIHQGRSQEHARDYSKLLDTYREAIRELMGGGLITRQDVQRLTWLRGQLQIKKADHDAILLSLADEERALLSDPARQLSAEKRLQLGLYRQALRERLVQLSEVDASLADRRAARLRAEYGVTESEHAAILDELLRGNQEAAEQTANAVRLVAFTTRALDMLASDGVVSDALLIDLLHRRRLSLIDRLLDIVDLADINARQTIRAGLVSVDSDERRAALDLVRGQVTPATRERLLSIEAELAAGALPTTVEGALRTCVQSRDPYIRAASLQALAERGAADLELLDRVGQDDYEFVREVVEALRSGMDGAEHDRASVPVVTTLQKMQHLRAIPLFESLEPTALAELGRASIDVTYTPGETLCRQGEPGNDVFVVLAGEVEIYQAAGVQDSIIEVGRVDEIVGELAIVDPEPRAATVTAGPAGARILRLEGEPFRQAMLVDSTVAMTVIGTLARRLRAARSSTRPPPPRQPPTPPVVGQ